MNSLKLFAIPLLAMSLSAFAQDAPPPPSQDRGGYDAGPATGAEQHRHRRFVDVDADRDGRLSRSEAQAMPFVARRFDVIDTDRDGYVSRAELRAAHERMQAARAARRGGNGQYGDPSYNRAPAPDAGDEGMN
jgi:hypothetical protein